MATVGVKGLTVTVHCSRNVMVVSLAESGAANS